MSFILAVLLALLLVVIMLPRLRSKERRKLTLPLAQQLSDGDDFVLLSQGWVHYRLEGQQDGPFVVMLNGFSVPHYVWDENARALVEQGYRVLRFDTYGRGLSARPLGPYDRKFLLSQVDELLSALDLATKPIHLVGLSMGGALAAAYAREYPERVASLSLLAPLHKTMEIGPLAIPLLGEWLMSCFSLPKLAESQAEDLVEPNAHAAWLVRYAQQMQFKGFGHAILSTLRHFMQDDPRLDFRDVASHGLPTLLLWGEHDRLFPVSEAESVRQSLGEHCQFQLVENAAHALQYERAEQVNLKLIHFLEQHRARP